MFDNSSDEDDGLETRQSTRKGSRVSTASFTSTSAVIGNISEDVLRVWSKLPEAIRLDPSLAYFQKEYEKAQERALSGTEDDGYLNPNEKLNTHERKLGPIARYIKLALLVSCWMAFFITLMITSEKYEIPHQIIVPKNEIQNLTVIDGIYDKRISVTIEGSLLPNLKENVNNSLSRYYLSVWLEMYDQDSKKGVLREDYMSRKNISEVWTLSLFPPELIDVFPNQQQTKLFQLQNYPEKLNHRLLILNLKTNLNTTIPLTVSYDVSPINAEDGIAYGAIVLVGLYVLIVFEIVHRTIAAMLASTSSLAILAALHEKPTMSEIISWIDVDTLLLLFSMMILVAVVADTGVFDYLAVYAYKITSGQEWPLVSTLCFFTAIVSIFLDNVTTVLLMTPVTIRLCEVMQLNPVPVLTAMVIFSNIGGAMTPVGDPPNVIIASNRDVVNAGVGFGTYTAHMSIGVILVLIIVYGHFRFIFRNLEVLRFDEPQDVQELRHEILVWQRAAASLSSYSKEENLVRETLIKKVKRLLQQLKQKLITGSVLMDHYRTTLEELQAKYPIRNKLLLAKSGFSMILVIVLFFFHSLPHFNLSLGWTSFLCVLLLLILADTEDLDGLMARVEWSTLLFFAALFVLMEALTKLGLMAWIGKKTELVILSVSEESRLAVAILLLLWVSAIAGAFVDNVPLTTMMIRIVTGLAENGKLQLPLQPLIWALAFGACMGGNGTLIGATANVVCAGVAEQHGYRFTFMQFFKMGFPVLFSSTMTITVYLMVAHVIFDWNN
ncbi:PREDICTED: P protein [Ceratosolen solmsi marchali]|uniref:P protein n=1 Tax=Ceratosolen solmsi marchali TaxID=326594 RepID=A0AAJ6YKA7_9HYME|nr:PREDICTED: P protein [Ceratosolen solmsi marchali]